MAIDTENKRRSVQAYAGGSGIVMPEPDGAVDTADRSHAAWLYSGLNYSGVTPPAARIKGPLTRLHVGRMLP